jgi:nitrogen regulatory protein PII
MKKIEAIIRKNKFETVMNALVAGGIKGMTVSEVQGRGSEPLPMVTYRGATSEQPLAPHTKLEVIVHDGEEDSVLDAIFQNAHTGKPGDGRILVTNLDSVVRIRTGEVDDTTATDSEMQRRSQQPARERPAITPLRPANWSGPRTFTGTDESAMNYWATH